MLHIGPWNFFGRFFFSILRRLIILRSIIIVILIRNIMKYFGSLFLFSFISFPFIEFNFFPFRLLLSWRTIEKLLFVFSSSQAPFRMVDNYNLWINMRRKRKNSINFFAKQKKENWKENGTEWIEIKKAFKGLSLILEEKLQKKKNKSNYYTLRHAI